MNDEEKQALEILKGLEFYEYEWYVRTDIFEGHAGEIVEKVEKAIEIIVSLINKQQKEIEKLKSKKYILNAETNEIKEIPISENYISKDKINAKIEELENTYDENDKNDYHNQFIVDCVAILEELLQGGQESDQEGG